MGVALTFDDGPHPINTPKLLAVLEQFKESVTFFVVGQMVKARPGVLRQISASQLRHQVCNHSWSHPNFKKLSDAYFRKQIEDTDKQIEDVLGISATRVLRHPYGAITQEQREIAKSMGYRLEGWNVDPLDWKVHNAQSVSRAILNHTHDGNVVLSHDIHATTVEAMKTVVPELQRKFMPGTVSGLNLFTTGALG
jgi:peptidoglycan/xylan/chitin deacetylase (PgdA/CDA1 family)